ncbi:MAG: hypothetical protein RL398_872 [Planctomycetota bacterium]|jgi:hypothetical protein
MADKKPNPAFDFTVEFLKKNPGATFAEVRDAADKKKLTIYPIMYGRSQALLGIIKSKPRGEGKAKVAKAAKAAKAAAPAAAPAPLMIGAPVKRGPGRPRKNPLPVAAAADLSSLDGIVAAIKTSEQAKARYRTALERIHAILSDALSQ